MNYLLSTLSRFPSLLRSLVKAVLEGEDGSGLHRGERSALLGGDQREDLPSPGNNNGEGSGDGVVVGVTTGGGGLDGEEGMAVSSDGGGIADDPPLQGGEAVVGGAFSWEELAAPASRLCAACRPFDLAQLDVLDEIIGEVYRHR